jgi:hypothetical protein
MDAEELCRMITRRMFDEPYWGPKPQRQSICRALHQFPVALATPHMTATVRALPRDQAERALKVQTAAHSLNPQEPSPFAAFNAGDFAPFTTAVGDHR